MPRQARIDAPGALHHIICRGIERRNIFKDNTDRNRFLERLGSVWEMGSSLLLTLFKEMGQEMEMGSSLLLTLFKND